MWDNKRDIPIWEYLGWTFLIAGGSYSFVLWGINSKLYIRNWFRIVVALVDTLIGTFSPMYGAYLVLKRHQKVKGLKEFAMSILRIENVKKTIIVTLLFCIPLLLITIMVGTRTDSSLFLFVPAIILMVFAGGVEEVGWRGFLQPALEKRLPFIFATLSTAGAWMLWHLPLWLIEGTSQADFKLFPYFINLIADSFILAAIYFLTKSVMGCIFYHAWGNAIGAIYEWDVFASYPIHKLLLGYYAVMIAIVIILRLHHKHYENQLHTEHKKL